MDDLGKIQRISTKEEFMPLLKKGIPVIITDIVENWPAYSLFSMEYFSSFYADLELPCKLDHGIERMTFSKLSQHLKSNDSELCYSPQLPLFNYLNIGKEGDIGSQACPPPDWLESFNETNIWIGRGVTTLHFDGYDNLLAVIEGEKKLMLFPPEAISVAQTKGQWCQVRAKELAEIYPKYFDIVVKPGELLYLPPYWLHEVSVPTANAISINYWYHQQYGNEKSNFLPMISNLIGSLEQMIAELNKSEKLHVLRILEDMIEQFKKGSYPVPQSGITWSHHGNENAMVRINNYIRPEFIYRNKNNESKSGFLGHARKMVDNLEQMAPELNDGERGHFVRVMAQIITQFKQGNYPLPPETDDSKPSDYYRATLL